ncbi:MAG: lysozyme inhibitor LprI family protein [Candidatus Thiodiazotropha endolucinida]
MILRLLVADTLAILLVLANSAAAQEAGMPASGPVRVMQQWVEPDEYRGACPATLRFTTKIQKGGWGIVKYRWVRSDGHRTQPVTIDFPDWRHKRVSMSWRVDPEPGEQIWASVEIIDPPGTEVGVPKAIARIRCEHPTLPETGVCEALHTTGPIASLALLCLQQHYDRAGVELTNTIRDLVYMLNPTEAETDDRVRQIEARRLRSLLKSQQNWEAYRDSACWEVYYEFWPGSMADDARQGCLVDLTEARTEYLRQRLGK